MNSSSGAASVKRRRLRLTPTRRPVPHLSPSLSLRHVHDSPTRPAVPLPVAGRLSVERLRRGLAIPPRRVLDRPASWSSRPVPRAAAGPGHEAPGSGRSGAVAGRGRVTRADVLRCSRTEPRSDRRRPSPHDNLSVRFGPPTDDMLSLCFNPRPIAIAPIEPAHTGCGCTPLIRCSLPTLHEPAPPSDPDPAPSRVESPTRPIHLAAHRAAAAIARSNTGSAFVSSALVARSAWVA